MKSKLDIVKDAIEDRKGSDIKVFDLKDISSVTDYFVICTGSSPNHTRAIADEIEEKISEAGYDYRNKEGFREGTWILVDLNDIVVHIFTEEERDYYQLDRLWQNPDA